jgi:hypothetical protein
MAAPAVAPATVAGDGATVEPCGDQAFLVRLGTRIDPAVNTRAQALATRLRAEAPAWLVDCVPSYANALVGSPPDAAVLEVTCPGGTPTFALEEPRLVALAGADLGALINGKRQLRRSAAARGRSFALGSIRRCATVTAPARTAGGGRRVR